VGALAKPLGTVFLGLVVAVCGLSAANTAPAAPKPDPPPVVKRPQRPPPPRPSYRPPPPVRHVPPPPVRQAPPPPVSRGPSATELAAQRRAVQRRAAAAKRRAAAARARANHRRAERAEAAKAAREAARRKAEAQRRRAEVAGTVAEPESPLAGAAPIALAALVVGLLLLGLAFTPAHSVPWYWVERTLVDRREQFLMTGAAGLVAAGVLFTLAFLGS
jgi:hypothetical protein